MNKYMELKQNFISYLHSTKNEKSKQIHALYDAYAEDEADLMKVERNILNIFETVYIVTEKKNGQNPELIPKYLNQFEQISEKWTAQLEQAKQTEDYETAAIEERKLTTSKQIRATFISICDRLMM